MTRKVIWGLKAGSKKLQRREGVLNQQYGESEWMEGEVRERVLHNGTCSIEGFLIAVWEIQIYQASSVPRPMMK